MSDDAGGSGGGFVVRVPGSSANLGPGFDALGLAVTLHVEVGTGPPPPGAHAADEHHPATVASARLGGTAPLWVRSPIPMGRGLGYSGAVRVAGAIAATVQRTGPRRYDLAEVADEVFEVTAALEGHADNVAASLLGGLVATAGGRAVRVPLGSTPAVVVWIPPATTSTERSRRELPDAVARDDAVFNVGRTALLVAALAAGDVDVLRTACEDRLHQRARFELAPTSGVALEAGLSAGAWSGWLSGSGPTVAFLCAPPDADAVAAALPADGQARVLGIDRLGAVVGPFADAS
jgi:homoserine kinase